MVDFPQSNERMAPASEALYEAINGTKLVHNGDPVLAAHVLSGITTESERGWRLTKRKGMYVW